MGPLTVVVLGARGVTLAKPGAIGRIEYAGYAGIAVSVAGLWWVVLGGYSTAESLMDQAETILARAMDSHQYGAAVSALKEKSILSGKRIERSEVGLPGEFDHLSDDELRDEIVREVRELGLILVESSERQHEGDCSKK
jgi:hypothetical protein